MCIVGHVYNFLLNYLVKSSPTALLVQKKVKKLLRTYVRTRRNWLYLHISINIAVEYLLIYIFEFLKALQFNLCINTQTGWTRETDSVLIVVSSTGLSFYGGCNAYNGRISSRNSSRNILLTTRKVSLLIQMRLKAIAHFNFWPTLPKLTLPDIREIDFRISVLVSLRRWLWWINWQWKELELGLANGASYWVFVMGWFCCWWTEAGYITEPINKDLFEIAISFIWI